MKKSKKNLNVDKTLELKKHVAAIHSSHKLSLIQRKIANALLFNAYNELLVQEEHHIQIRVLCNLIGYDSNDYKTIKKGLINLLSTVIEWNLVDGNKLDAEGIWNASSIIADASIEGGVCTYSYSNKMKKLLYSPELYGRLNMVVQAKFQSTYGLALYENCIRYQNIEQTPWFDIAQFRKLMGVEDNKYLIFRDFKRRVLDKAIEEVNKYSPLTIELRLKRQARKVVGLQFAIKKGFDEEDAPERVNMPLSQRLKVQFGFSGEQIDETLTKYDEEYINEKILIVETSQSYQKGRIQNLAKYLLRAMNDDFQPTKSSAIKQKPDLNADKDATLKLNAHILMEYRRYQSKKIFDLFEKQKASAKKQLLKNFEISLGKSLYQDIYKRDGIKNILIKEQLCEFIKNNNQDWLKELMDIGEFIKSIKEKNDQEIA